MIAIADSVDVRPLATPDVPASITLCSHAANTRYRCTLVRSIAGSSPRRGSRAPARRAALAKLSRHLLEDAGSASWRYLHRPCLRAITVVALAVSSSERTHVATDAPDYTPRSVERSGPAIRAALLTYASAEECAQFEAEFRSALALAADSLDLSGPQAVLKHWQAVAIIAANPLTDEEREQLERAKAGDFSGLIAMHQGEDGNWVSR